MSKWQHDREGDYTAVLFLPLHLFPYAEGRLNNAGTEARVVLQAVPRVRNIWPLNHQARVDVWWLHRLTTARKR